MLKTRFFTKITFCINTVQIQCRVIYPAVCKKGLSFILRLTQESNLLYWYSRTCRPGLYNSSYPVCLFGAPLQVLESITSYYQMFYIHSQFTRERNLCCFHPGAPLFTLLLFTDGTSCTLHSFSTVWAPSCLGTSSSMPKQSAM
jgi:hypothetical protein